MRVLHVNSMLTGGGTDDRSVRIAHGLMQLGHETWMAGPEGREFSPIVRELGIPFHATPAGGILRLPFILSVARCIRRHEIQIVHGRHGRDYWPTVLAARLSGRKPKIALSRHLAKSPGSWASRRFLLRYCDAMIAVSRFTAQVLREGVSEPDSPNPERRYRPPMKGDLSRIHVVYGGIDMDRFQPADADAHRAEWNLQPGQYAFAVAGGYFLPRGKGQREFLQAAARVRDALPHARFLLIGRGNMAEILQADIQRLGLTGRAWLTPYCHNMPVAMNAIDCLVHAQVGTEALPGVICEAHACGKPVIASDLDGVVEGQIIPRESVEALAAAMLTWARRPPLDSKARWELHSRVARCYSLPVASKSLADLYERLLLGTPSVRDPS
jgi:glycosyltransferase involved in cell wall biosynthesis